MYNTLKREIERRGEALDTVWFQLDNTCRENKNKHTHKRVDQVFSKFSVSLDDHAAFTKAQLLHELRQAFTPTCNFMELEGVLDNKTWLGNFLPRQGHVLNTADPGKAFAEMEKEIWKVADRLHFSADERREWEEEFASLRELETMGRTPFLAFWPESIPRTELDTWLGALIPGRDLDPDDPMSARMSSQPRLDQTCQGTARRYADLQEELRVLTYNPITINTSTQCRKRRRGAQAAMTTGEHSNEGDSEADRHEGVQGVAIPLQNEDTTRREFDARPGNLVVMDNTADNPDPYREEGLLGDWEKKYLAAYSRDPKPDSSWEAAKKIKWMLTSNMPLTLFSLRFPNVRRTARQCQHDFRGTKLTAVTSMKGVSEIKGLQT
eukprot:jgi/Tetstr1/444616/TSEL_032464.t1